ncbi:MAG: heme ABC transporter ATP-binding protein [Acidimicrobiaceae bacterium]|nr:heme ABC transporter ATP-binding protein [Acidimicrobiaceae bacterium]
MSATLTLHELTVARGARILLDEVSLVVAPGDRIGVVGPNGVGKSTLLRAAAGLLSPDRGEVRLAPPTATVGLLDQEPARSGETVGDVLRRRTGVRAADAELEAATEAMAAGDDDAADRYDRALQRWLALGAADFDARVGAVCADLGLPDRVLAQPTEQLSGGEAARAGLAALLLSRFDIYLLDEPTNDLDLDGLDRLERWVLGLDAPVVLVSHDRRFLDRVVTGVAEIDEFSHRLDVFGGGWQAYLDERERARRHAWERFEEYDTQRRSLSQRAQRQREWAQQGQAKVRRSANDEPDKNIRAFRLDQTEQLAGKAAQTKRAIDRLDAVEKPREAWELRLDIPAAERSGTVVARLVGAEVDRGSFRLGPIDLLVEYGERIAIRGRNGSGKSTLIDLITGRLEPTSGTVMRGSGVVVGEIEQVRELLTGASTLVRAFVDATGLDVAEARTLLAKFGLVGDHVERETASLSPGERTRAGLALLMANGANLLVLDEPTNHLDLPAIEQLEQALDTFPGTILLVTHDRTFLDQIRITRTIDL